MNDAPFSVLLLAWDEADPAPGALGAPLPPAAALQAALAAQLSLTAILPQQLAGDMAPVVPASPPTAPTPAFDEAPLEPAASSAILSALTQEPELTPADPNSPLSAPGTAAARQPDAFSVSAVAPEPGVTPQPTVPVLIGLADFTLAELNAEAQRRGGPSSVASYAHSGWQVPAAPYLGSTAGEQRSASTSLAVADLETPKAEQTADFSALNELFSGAKGAVLAALLAAAGIARTLESADSYSAEAFGLPAADSPLPTSETTAFDLTADPGPAEAAALQAAAADPEPELARPAALAALRRPAPMPAEVPVAPSPPKAGVSAPAAVLALAASLSFRVIQYARFATQLTAGGTGFSAVLALAWPTWLAAVEIRQRTGRPLVLYVSELPSEQAPPATRGWLRELERQAFLRADVVLVPTPALAEQLGARFPLRPRPQVLPGGLPSAANPVLASGQLAFAAAVLAQLRAATGAAA